MWHTTYYNIIDVLVDFYETPLLHGETDWGHIYMFLLKQMMIRPKKNVMFVVTWPKKKGSVGRLFFFFFFFLGHSNLITCLTSFFGKKNPVRLPPPPQKKSRLWCLTDESGLEIFCQTPKKKKKKHVARYMMYNMYCWQVIICSLRPWKGLNVVSNVDIRYKYRQLNLPRSSNVL